MLIQGGTVVDGRGERRADVRIGPDGRIVEVGPSLEEDPAEETYRATGKLVLAGAIDVHTHMQLPVGAVTVSDDFSSGSKAAALGGTTTIIDYVTPVRGEDPLEAVRRWHERASASWIDWSLHLSFTEAVPEQVVADAAEAGISSFKLYLAYPDRLQVDDGVVLRMLRFARRHGVLVNFHCENGYAIEELRREALAAGRLGVEQHAATRPAALEAEAVHRASVLAELAGAQIYVVHLSSAAGLRAVLDARSRGVGVYAETCPQYLFLDERMLERGDGADFVCAPPLRTRDDADALWRGVAAGEIQTIATDHCPFRHADRRRGTADRPSGFRDFTEIPGGLPGVETRLALVWEGVRQGRISRTDWIRSCVEEPARIFGMWPAKGCLCPGADGDVVVWDPDRPQRLDATDLDMAVDHSPYEGMTVHGWPALVTSRGRVVARDGRAVGEPGWGRFVARSTLGADP